MEEQIKYNDIISDEAIERIERLNDALKELEGLINVLKIDKLIAEVKTLKKELRGLNFETIKKLEQ